MDFAQLLFWGCIGGALPDAVRLIKGRFGSTPGYLKSGMFWLGLFLLIALGGLLAWLGGAKETKEALAYGYAGPELLSRLLSTKGAGAGEDRAVGEFQLFRSWAK